MQLFNAFEGTEVGSKSFLITEITTQTYQRVRTGGIAACIQKRLIKHRLLIFSTQKIASIIRNYRHTFQFSLDPKRRKIFELLYTHRKSKMIFPIHQAEVALELILECSFQDQILSSILAQQHHIG